MPPTITKSSGRAPVIQTRLDLRDPRRRPMIGMNGAMNLLDLDAWEIEPLLERRGEKPTAYGRLIGFNIAVDETGRRELRFLTESLEHFLASLTNPKLCPYYPTWPQILKLVLPHDKPVITGVELSAALNCDSQHVLNLLDARLLKLVPGSDPMRRGPNGSPALTRASFEDFLDRRLQ